MGQYYKPISIDREEYICSHDYDNGLKLMEHSYVGNVFLNTIEKLLSPKNKWHKTAIVWAGDYADHDPNIGTNLYDFIQKSIQPKQVDDKYKHGRFIVNHSKGEYVDIAYSPTDIQGWQVHPLPLLTCEGNGRGGGDYRKDDNPFIGAWARDVISIEKKRPTDILEIKPEFHMD